MTTVGLAAARLRPTLRGCSTQKCAHGIRLERPIELASAFLVAQHGHACAVAALEFDIIVDPDRIEIRHARGSEHSQSLVAEGAFVALVQVQAHLRAEG